MGRLIGSVLLVLCIPAAVFSQQKLIEILIEQETEFYDESSAMEYLEYLSENPVNINTASIDELLLIPGISFLQANGIIYRRTRVGNFRDLIEVRKAGNIPVDWFELIRSFMVLEEKQLISSYSLRQRAIRSLNIQRGYDNGYFSGDPFKNYTRIRFKTGNNISGGLIAEKDPGEKDLNDHLAGFIEWRSNTETDRIIIGEYSLGFGQGLVFWRKFGFYKSLDAVYPVRRTETGGRGYTSSGEGEGFRGIFYDIKRRDINLCVFASNTHRDAAIDSAGIVERIYGSGYHRTENELEHKDRLKETMFGARIGYLSNNGIDLGVTAVKYHYKNSLPVTVFDSGLNSARIIDNLRIAGADFRLNYNKIMFFGEAAFSSPGSIGFVSGMIWSENNSQIGLLYRNYSPEFYSPSGNGFSDSFGGNINEKGLYFGLKHKIGDKVLLNIYSDIVKIPQKGISSYDNSNMDIFLKVDYRLLEELNIYAFWKRRIKTDEIESDNEYGITGSSYIDTNDDRFRLNISYYPNSNLSVFSRTEVRDISYVNGSNNSSNPGYLISKGLRFNPDKVFRLDLGAVVFETNKNRIYLIESDLPGVLNLRQYSGRGQRVYMLARYNHANFRYSFKYSLTHYSDRDNIGSGSNMIAGSLRQDIGFQIDYIKR